MDKQSLKRKNNVQQAVANERLEGLKVSKDSLKIADNYIAGKASAKQAAKKNELVTESYSVRWFRRPLPRQFYMRASQSIRRKIYREATAACAELSSSSVPSLHHPHQAQ